MTLLFVSFIAGVLTVLAPCSLTLLPVIIGGSASGKNHLRPVIITLSLAVSVILFTLLLRASTALIGVPPEVWTTMSALILLVFGFFMIFPGIWDRINVTFGFSQKSDKLLDDAVEKETWYGPLLLGASLGPVFSSCSPTYAILIATILPQDFLTGIINILAYTLGLSLVLLLIGFLGQKFISKLRWAANPNGWFRKSLGVLIIFTGVLILMGWDKDLEAWFLQNENLNALINFEYDLIDNTEID